MRNIHIILCTTAQSFGAVLRWEGVADFIKHYYQTLSFTRARKHTHTHTHTYTHTRTQTQFVFRISLWDKLLTWHRTC
jgi:hypothetical protein